MLLAATLSSRFILAVCRSRDIKIPLLIKYNVIKLKAKTVAISAQGDAQCKRLARHVSVFGRRTLDGIQVKMSIIATSSELASTFHLPRRANWCDFRLLYTVSELKTNRM